MVRMLTIAHAARCACQATRNQAQPWWGTIDKFEVTAFYWRVSIPLYYLFEPLLRSDKPSRPRCRDQGVINAKTNVRTANVVTTAPAAIPARTNATAKLVESARAPATLAPAN